MTTYMFFFSFVTVMSGDVGFERDGRGILRLIMCRRPRLGPCKFSAYEHKVNKAHCGSVSSINNCRFRYKPKTLQMFMGEAEK